MMARIREVIASHGELGIDVNSVADDEDLYKLGLTSFATVQVMLGLEEAFDVEMPEHLLNRATFSSLSQIQSALAQVVTA
ncbi:MAG: acyl carrier protein [Caulobacteraceae bacterium]